MDAIFVDRDGIGNELVPLRPQITPRSVEVPMSEVLVLLITALLPILAAVLVIYLVVRLAIRREHRNHSDR